jgi:uncharacterized membrane protein YoaT (DUF817 family)
VVYQAFFAFCILVVVLVILTFECRYRALAVGLIGLVGGYMLELFGVSTNSWDYGSVDSLLFISDIPIEILFGYFSGAFFLMVLVENLPDVGTREARERVMRVAFLVAGVFFLALTFSSHAVSFTVGWAFLGLFGFSVSKDKSVPMAVGMVAFVLDWLVEGLLTSGTEYYPKGWDATIGLVFMFVAMFLAGVLSNWEYILGFLGRHAETNTT